MVHVDLYTDGSCDGNPGPGGWGVILIQGKHYKELHGEDRYTTNNRMELTAVIEGLKALKQPCEVTITSDSKYVTDAFNKHWLDTWLKSRRIYNGSVKNPDLWLALSGLTKIHTCKFVWVKGHANNKYNNRCDELARMRLNS